MLMIIMIVIITTITTTMTKKVPFQIVYNPLTMPQTVSNKHTHVSKLQ